MLKDKFTGRMVTVATALLTLASVGASVTNAGVAFAADGGSDSATTVNANNFTKEGVTALVDLAKSDGFQEKAKASGQTDLDKLNKAVDTAQKALASKDKNASDMIYNAGSNLKRIMVKIDNNAKINLNKLVSEATQKMPSANAEYKDSLNKALNDGRAVLASMESTPDAISAASSNISTALEQMGYSVSGNTDSQKSPDKQNTDPAKSDDSKHSNDDSKSKGMDNTINKNTEENKDHQTNADLTKNDENSAKNGKDSDVTVSEDKRDAEDILKDSLKLANSNDMQLKSTLASRDEQDALKTAIDDAKKASGKTEANLANKNLVAAMNAINKSAKEPLVKALAEMTAISKTYGFGNLDQTVQREFNQAMQQVSSVVNDPDASYASIIAAEKISTDQLATIVSKADKHDLNSAIEDLENLQGSGVFEGLPQSSKTALTRALNKAKEVAGNTTASQKDVNDAAKDLREAQRDALADQIENLKDKVGEKGDKKDADKNASDKDGAASSLDNLASKQPTTRADALKALAAAIKKGDQVKASSAYENASDGAKDALKGALYQGKLDYADSFTSVKQLNKDTRDINAALSMFNTSKSNGTKQLSTNGNSNGNLSNNGSGSSNGSGSNGRSDNSGANGSGSGDNGSANNGTGATNSTPKSQGALPQTGRYLMKHAKAAIAGLGAILATLAGVLVYNNKKRDGENENSEDDSSAE